MGIVLMGELNVTPPALQDLTHKEHPYDIFKDSYFRFLGYTNELGEAFRPLLPRPLVTATYGVVFLYAVADTVDKSKRAYDVSNHHRTPSLPQSMDLIEL